MCQFDKCPCPRYIPQENPGPGPRLCRDCEHWESLHPVQEAPKVGVVSDVISRILPQIKQVRGSDKDITSDDEARREASSGFRKANGDRGGRGGNTRFTKKPSNRTKKESGTTTADEAIPVGHIVLIPNPHWPSGDDTESDDVREMGVATVPSITRHQQLKDGGLAVDAEDFADGISFKEKWDAKRIDKWMHHYFSDALEYQENKHLNLEDGKHHWVVLAADRKKLVEFKKKDEINGKDLLLVKAGKGKALHAFTSTLTSAASPSALRFPVPDKVWHGGSWDTNPSDEEWSESVMGKGKAKTAKRGPGMVTRQSSRKPVPVEPKPAGDDPVGGESDGSVVEVEGPKGKPSPGPSSRTSTSTAGKIKAEQRTPIKSEKFFKLDPELAAIAKCDYLISPDSDSESEAEFKLTPVSSDTPQLTAGGLGPVSGGPSTLGSTSTTNTVPAPTRGATPPSSVVTPVPMHAPIPTVPFGVPTSRATLTSSSASNSYTYGAPSSFSLSSSSAGMSGSSGFSGPSTSSLRASVDRSRHYANSTDALETFNEFGNYREGTPPKRPLEAIMGSGFPSPERPISNPWKKRKTT
ncbi:hypothetical protein FB451DRAFT_1529308 [Mycena latifolia]|nr:hypothetical protein FB451DRAFT_1529308 [Mycena latifolia]